MADWTAVAFTVSVLPYWPRHVSGQFLTFGFGEVPDIVTLAVPVLLAGGIAVGLMILWLPFGWRLLRVAVATAVAVGGVLGAYRTAADWSAAPPLAGGHVAMACEGSAPRMCVPEFNARYLPQVQRDTAHALSVLHAAGVATAQPRLITDSYVDGRRQKPSTAEVWRMMLTRPVPSGDAVYQVVVRALHFRCARVDTRTSHTVWLWGATKTGQEKAYNKRREHEIQQSAAQELERQVQVTVTRVLAEPQAEQSVWIRRTLDTCEAKRP